MSADTSWTVTETVSLVLTDVLHAPVTLFARLAEATPARTETCASAILDSHSMETVTV